MNLTKLFGKQNNKILNVILILGIVALVGMILQYNSNKGMVMDSMSGNKFANAAEVKAETPEQPSGAAPEMSVEGPSSAAPVSTTDGDQFLPVSGIQSGSKAGSSCNNQKMMDPKDLLPKDANNEWSNIMPANDLKDVQMLNAGHHVGINTVGSSLRNANLQVRSEPVIPQTNIGPWNNTTIEPDNLRRGFELGSSE